MKIKKNVFLSALAGLIFAAQSNAAIQVSSTEFGPLSDEVISALDLNTNNIFGGSGISADPLQWATFDLTGDQEADVVLGIAATTRFNSPDVTNDGNGTYVSKAGESGPGLSFWNYSLILGDLVGDNIFDYFAPTSDNSFNISFEIAPNSGEFITYDYGQIFKDFASQIPAGKIFQFSENLGFNFLSDVTNPYVSGQPAVDNVTFNPFATGIYSLNANLSTVDDTSSLGINVAVVNAPAMTILVLMGVAGLFRLRK